MIEFRNIIECDIVEEKESERERKRNEGKKERKKERKENGNTEIR